MLPKVRVVRDCFYTSKVDLATRTATLTLLGSQESELISCTGVVRIALSVVAIFQNDSEAVELLHQDLYDYNDQHRSI
jgi:hypothetical protein